MGRAIVAFGEAGQSRHQRGGVRAGRHEDGVDLHPRGSGQQRALVEAGSIVASGVSHIGSGMNALGVQACQNIGLLDGWVVWGGQVLLVQ